MSFFLIMKIIPLSVLIISLVISSCKGKIEDPNTSDKALVQKVSYGLFHERELEIKSQLIIDSFRDFAVFRYFDPTNTDSLNLDVVKRVFDDDSILVYYDDTSRLVKSKTYQIEGRDIIVKKYFSDNGGIADGEYFIYWCDNLGLISIQSQAWGNFEMFYYENDKVSQLLKQDILGLFTRQLD